VNLEESDALVRIDFLQMPTTTLTIIRLGPDAFARPDRANLCQLARTKSHNTISVCDGQKPGLAPVAGRLAEVHSRPPDG